MVHCFDQLKLRNGLEKLVRYIDCIFFGPTIEIDYGAICEWISELHLFPIESSIALKIILASTKLWCSCSIAVMTPFSLSSNWYLFEKKNEQMHFMKLLTDEGG